MISIKHVLWTMYTNMKKHTNTYIKGDIIVTNTTPLMRISIGDYSYGNVELLAYSSYCEIEIGRYTSISEIKIIVGGNHHTDITTYPFKVRFKELKVEEDNVLPRPVKIGNDVWIGYGTILLDGANIGNGAVIGAGSIIRGNIPPYSIVIGNPATVVKYRFNREEIQQLLDSEWWQLSKDKLVKIIPLLYSKDVETFVSKVKELKTAV